jgi:hypothetical protein
VLVGRAEDVERLCGPCCGVDIDFSCRTCAHTGDIYAEGRCARCIVDDRVTDLLSRPGQPVAPELLPLAEALVRTRNPRSVLNWLRTSPAARLLATLVDRHTTIDHDTLDALPPHRNVDFLRATLVATGILPLARNSWPSCGPGSTRRWPACPPNTCATCGPSPNGKSYAPHDVTPLDAATPVGVRVDVRRHVRLNVHRSDRSLIAEACVPVSTYRPLWL